MKYQQVKSRKSLIICGILPLFALFVSLTGCSGVFQNSPSSKFLIPWPDASGNHSLQEVEIETISNLKQFSGSYGQFYLAPSKDPERNSLMGPTPSVHAVKSSSGVMVPTDTLSTQVLTVYAHFERLAKLDGQVGARNLSLWPRQVGLQVNLASSDYKVNNAVYYGKLNALLVVPYDKPDLPISLNAGIMAHEHFHSLFHRIVLEPLTKKYSYIHAKHFAHSYAQSIVRTFDLEESEERELKALKKDSVDQYNVLLLRGINEGFADYWGWLYTKDVDFISHSLPELKGIRSLSASKVRLPSTSVLKTKFNPQGIEGVGEAQAYRLGSNYARILKDLADESDPMTVARAMVAALKRFAPSAQSQFTKDYISPNEILVELSKELNEEQCSIIHKYEALEANGPKMTCVGNRGRSQ